MDFFDFEAAKGLRMPSTADELAAARRMDFALIAGSRRYGLLLSKLAAIDSSTFERTPKV
jgi:hypothetical protein